MADPMYSRDDLMALQQWDTPTICNGLEIVAPGRRAIGFTVESMVAADPKLPPMVGVARVGTIQDGTQEGIAAL